MNKLYFWGALIFLLFSQVTMANESWQDLKKYVLKSDKKTEFKGVKFAGSSEDGRSGKWSFLVNGKPLSLNSQCQIPYSIYYSFFENAIKSNGNSHYLVKGDCGEKIGIKCFYLTVPELHPDSIYKGYYKSDGKRKLDVYTLFYRMNGDSIYEVFVLTTSKLLDSERKENTLDGITNIFSFVYDESHSKILSTLLLFSQSGSFDSFEKFRFLDYNCDDEDSNTLSIEDDLYITYRTREDGGIQLGVRSGYEIYKFNDNINRYEQIWSSLYTFPKRVPSHVFTENGYDSPEGVIVVRNPKAYESEIQDKDGYVNVREKPDVKSKVLNQIKKDQKFIIDSEDCNGWYRVILCGNIRDGGWIHSSRVKKLMEMSNDFQNKYNINDYGFSEYDLYDVDDF